jgi:hypothetical protein
MLCKCQLHSAGDELIALTGTALAHFAGAKVVIFIKNKERRVNKMMFLTKFCSFSLFMCEKMSNFASGNKNLLIIVELKK